MKKTQREELISSIRHTRVSYIAMTLFVTLAVSFFLGLGWTGKAVELSVDDHQRRNCVHDVEILCPMGVSSELIEKLAADGAVLEAEGSHFAYAYFTHDSIRYHAALQQVTERIDLLTVREGALPEAADELAVDWRWATDNGLKVGDTVKLERGETGIMDTLILKEDTFTVTGIVVASAYASDAISYNPSLTDGGGVELQLYLPKTAFSEDMCDYTSILLRSRAAEKLLRSGEDYKQESAAFRDRLSGLMDTLGYDKPFTAQTHTSLIHTGTVKIVSDIFMKLRWNLAALFLVIGFLVCYCTVTRKIYQDTKSVGTQKALGFKARELTVRYLAYTGSAVLTGVAVGIILSLVIERSLWTVAAGVYYVDRFIPYFSLPQTALVFAAELVSLLLITLLCAEKAVHYPAVSLLTDNISGREGLNALSDKKRFSRLPLLTQTILRNLLHDVRRVISTLIGVAGCAALIVTAVTFFTNTYFSHGRMFREFFRFDTLVLFDAESETAEADIYAVLDGLGAEGESIYYGSGYIEAPDKDYCKVTVFVPMSGEAFPELVEPKRVYRDDSDDFSRGLFIGNGYRNYYGKDALGSIRLFNSDKAEHDLSADGSYFSTLLIYSVFADKETYKAQFGDEPAANAVILNADGLDLDDLQARLGETEGFDKLLDYDAYCKKTADTFTAVFISISAVFLVMSAVMAVLVLLNILTQFVDEKKTDIIILRINGFDRKYARRYIYTDTIILTVFGIIPGCAIGSAVGYFAIKSFDSNAICLLKSVVPEAWAIGAVCTGLLSFIMCRKALRRIDTFNLYDMNRP